ncbi:MULTISPECIES: Maf family protein [Psychrilyobacter]|uniref:dTTP/UTP pyrophosphatase n=1 Tax=Psychrilyobacter piezotolerans TaxID=2293438 RepID=A0ABX9KKR6_9FUSO|nr:MULTISPECIES: Maf family protein [Psychrilyobacter]MCS5420582.1 Maf family protein [Psychrilyobacter sp. S5]NDI76623.1 septum formation protein Maf [Psychrilyobacter piezotolerans]RDE65250.1 septum formation protein Maf [Psychrilyobacter sp. S5]REI42868.1 septum formation protein Maf [Psychrilyobacter piezotolerans]
MILASKSPRRFEILSNFGIKKIKVVAAEIEEISDKEDLIEQVVDIAVKKGVEVAKSYPDEFVLSADTVVILDDEILGKPKDCHEAFATLTSLSGRTHEVITAYSLINKSRGIFVSSYDKTVVKFKKLSESEINWYIETGEPMDKAGSYGIQGVGAGILIDRIEGEFYNVMGFPISKFVDDLKKHGIKIQNIIEL